MPFSVAGVSVLGEVCHPIAAVKEADQEDLIHANPATAPRDACSRRKRVISLLKRIHTINFCATREMRPALKRGATVAVLLFIAMFLSAFLQLCYNVLVLAPRAKPWARLPGWCVLNAPAWLSLFRI